MGFQPNPSSSSNQAATSCSVDSWKRGIAGNSKAAAGDVYNRNCEWRTELFFYSLVPPGFGGCLLGIAASFWWGKGDFIQSHSQFCLKNYYPDSLTVGLAQRRPSCSLLESVISSH